MHLHFILDEIQYNDLLSPLIAEARRRRHLVTTSLRFATRYDADAVIGLQDAALRACPRPRVFMTHGLGLAKRGALLLDVDLLLLPYGDDAGVIDDQAAQPGTRMTVARNLGSPKIDLLAERRRKAPALRQRLREIYGFDERPIVGYCPTWRHDGTLHHLQRGHRLREAEAALERDYNVVVLPHSLEYDKSEIEELRFQPSPALSRLDHLVALDGVVTDTSGIGFELCAIDMPMVLLDNPAEPDYLLARMLEQPVRIDYGPVCTLADLPAAVAASLAHPEAHAARRAFWADKAFGPRDGRAAERVIDAITDFVANRRGQFIPPPGEAMVLQHYRRGELQRLPGPLPWQADGPALRRPLRDRAGSIFYGPYQMLGAGRFALELDLEAATDKPLELRVDTAGGKVVLAQMPIEGRVRASLPFTIPPAMSGCKVEYRLRQPADGKGEVLLYGLRLLLTALPEPELTTTWKPPLPPPSPPEPMAAPQPAPAPPPAPLPDPNWQEIALFLAGRVAPEDRILAPEAFRPQLPPHRRMDAYQRDSGRTEAGLGPERDYDWVVLHKGWLEGLPMALLMQLKEAARPVMANSVFIVWQARELPDLRQTRHVRAFMERLQVLDMQNYFARVAAGTTPGETGPELAPEEQPVRE